MRRKGRGWRAGSPRTLKRTRLQKQAAPWVSGSSESPSAAGVRGGGIGLTQPFLELGACWPTGRACHAAFCEWRYCTARAATDGRGPGRSRAAPRRWRLALALFEASPPDGRRGGAQPENGGCRNHAGRDPMCRARLHLLNVRGHPAVAMAGLLPQDVVLTVPQLAVGMCGQLLAPLADLLQDLAGLLERQLHFELSLGCAV